MLHCGLAKVALFCLAKYVDFFNICVQLVCETTYSLFGRCVAMCTTATTSINVG